MRATRALSVFVLGVLCAVIFSGCLGRLQFVEDPPTAPVEDIQSLALVVIPNEAPELLLKQIVEDVIAILARKGGFSIQAPNITEHYFRELGMTAEDVASADMTRLAETLGTDGILILKVEEYMTQLTFTPYVYITVLPSLTLDVSVLDLSAGEVIWSTRIVHEGPIQGTGEFREDHPKFVEAFVSDIVRDLIPRRGYTRPAEEAHEQTSANS